MSLLYTIVPKKNPQDPAAPEQYYLQSKIRGKKLHRDIITAAAKNTTLSLKEVDASVFEWLGALFVALSDGFSVEVEGLGVFSTSIRSNPSPTEAEATATKVKDIALAFRAKPEVYERLNAFKLEKFNPTGTL